MKNKISLIFTIFVTLFSGFLIIHSINVRKKLNFANEEIQIANTQKKTEIYLDSYIPDQIEAELKQYDLIILKDESDQRFEISSVLDQPTLILRFRTSHCNTCIMQELTLFKQQYLKSNSRKLSALVLGEFSSVREFNIMKSSLKNTGIKLMVIESGFDSIVDSSPVPYSFVYFPKRNSIGLTFISEKSQPQRSMAYYSDVLSKLAL